MLQPICQPLQPAICFLHSPIPHTDQRPLRVACLPHSVSCISGQWSGLPRSLHPTTPPLRLYLSTVSLFWYRTVSAYNDVQLSCHSLAEANNCRRPVNTYDGSGGSSLTLAIGFQSLALMKAGNLPPIPQCYHWRHPRRKEHCQSSFTQPG